MNETAIYDLIHSAVTRVQEAEAARLDSFYRLPPEQLKGKESTILIQNALQLPLRAQEVMEKAMEGHVPYVHTAWREISEKLPVISYTYIDWESLDPANQRVYSRQVSTKDLEKIKSGGPVALPVGRLVVGTIALLYILLVPGGPAVKLFAGVVAAGAGGSVLVRALTEEKPQEPDATATAGALVASHGKDVHTQAIALAHSANREALKKWCETLEQATLDVCKEVMT